MGSTTWHHLSAEEVVKQLDASSDGLTFALTLGARPSAARHAVVRRLSVVESLGSVDTICTDKTGTLTQNLMTVQRVLAEGQLSDLAHSTADAGDPAEVLRPDAWTVNGGLATAQLVSVVLMAVAAAGLVWRHRSNRVIRSTSA